MIAAVTFDFWDTLAIDDSDEPIRAERGLLTKAQERRQLCVDEIARHHPELPAQAVIAAFDAANEWFNRCWKGEHFTPTVAARMAEGYRRLRLAPTPGFAALVARLEMMEVNLPPRPVPGVLETLPELARRYRLGVISDTIVTPGRGLRAILREWGLLQHFSPEGLIFSDEVGVSKPHPDIFTAACEGLGLPPASVAHVGDRASNDVDGPRRAGMKAIRITAAVDRGPGAQEADAVCADFADLPAILAAL